MSGSISFVVKKLFMNLYFNGSNSKVYLDNNLPASISVTMEAWVYPVQDSPMVVINQGSETRLNYQMHIDANRNVEVRWYNPVDGWTTMRWTEYTVPLNTWTYLCSIIKPGESNGSKIYLNSLIGQTTYSQFLNTNAGDRLRVGLDRDDISSPFKGYIKNVIVTTDTTISESVILEHAADNYSNIPGADVYWKLDEHSGDIAIDSSGEGNNGTIFNGSWQSI